ncbi:MAG: hypothetical protein PVH73_05345 [Candidatus Bathyarchaeota archaeon]|jgi:hypothetical protein
MNKRIVIPVIAAVLIIVVVVAGFIALQDGAAPENNNKPSGDNKGTFSVDSSGGWVKPTDSAVSICFYEGSVSEKIDVTVESTTDLPEEEGLVPELGFDFGPDGARFNIPAYLYIDYSEVTLPEGVEEYMLRIYKVENGNFTLVQDCEVDLESKTVKGRISTFSKYVVMGKDYGFIVTTNKDRIASDGQDYVMVTCYLKRLKAGDTSEPTGEPIRNAVIRVELTSNATSGAIIGEMEPFNLITNEYGYVRFENEATPNEPPRYGVAKFSFLNLAATIDVGIGFDWPYYEHFDDSLGSEWSSYDVITDGVDTNYVGPQPISIKTSPNGQERFLGPFTTDQLVLTLDNIPEHYRIVLEFDFIAIGPWQEGVDQCWVTIKNDPDQEIYHYCSLDVSLQEEDYTGGFDENDIINTLGYPTGTLVYTDNRGEEQELEKGDGVFHLETNMIQHRKDSIQIAFNVDERGFGEASDVGQYWGIDNVYVRYWAPETTS